MNELISPYWSALVQIMVWRLFGTNVLNQCWVIANWNFRNKFMWYFNQNTKLFIHKNATENILCETAAILSGEHESAVEAINFSPAWSLNIRDINTGRWCSAPPFTLSPRPPICSRTIVTVRSCKKIRILYKPLDYISQTKLISWLLMPYKLLEYFKQIR